MDFIEMNEKHIDEIISLEKEIFEEPYSEEVIRKIKTYEMYDFFICLDEKVLGYAIISSILDESDLLRIAVKKEYRKQDIANRLLQKLIEKCKVQEIKKIHLEVRASNDNAILLYKKNGFLPVGMRKNYYINPTEDAILMTLEV